MASSVISIDQDTSRWTSARAQISGKPSTPTEVTIHYIACPPPKHTKSKGTILLIHGYPETSYQFRHVITPLSDAGYHVVAPDYRGAGHSSHPRDGYEKVQMATDLHDLLKNHLGINDKIHVVGHDIGAMVAHAFAARFSDDTASVTWGECPLPGTTAYDRFVREETQGGVWHFVFHWQMDLPEALTHGRERLYIQHFYDRLSVNRTAISPSDIDHYASMFSQPGAMRSGFEVYRAFHQDAEDNRKWVKKNGKCKVPSMSLNGDGSFLAVIAQEQNDEMYEATEISTVNGSGHWCAEENPLDFVKKVLMWVEKHPIKEN